VTEDLIPKEDDVITITNSGYIKRIAVDAYKQQRRGGKGVMGMETKEEDFVSDLFIAILMITSFSHGQRQGLLVESIWIPKRKAGAWHGHRQPAAA